MGASLDYHDILADDADARAEDADATTGGEPTAEGAPRARGPLLDLPEPEAAKKAMREIKRRHAMVKRLKARWKANALRRAGVAGVELVKSEQDQAMYEVWAPPSSQPLAPIPNKANTLCRRLTSHMFVDPPVPDAMPETDAEEDLDAAELATRILQVECEDIRLNAAMRRAFSLAGTYGSVFVRLYADPYAGGFRPKTVQAAADAPEGTPEDQALVTMDQATGEPRLWGGDLVTRYCTAQGTITDDPGQAMQQWLPRLCTEVLNPKHVLLCPETATSIDDADGIITHGYKPVGEMRSLYPDAAIWQDEDKLRKLAGFRPEGGEDLMGPSERRRLHAEQDRDGKDGVKDDALIYVHTHTYRACHEYPRGAQVIVGGETCIFDRREWVEHQQDGTIARLDLPLVQVKQFADEDDDDVTGPYAQGVMDLIGSPNELRVMAIAAIAEHLQRHTDRKTFLPITSTLQPRQLQAPGRTVLPINPGAEPSYEEIPDFPKEGAELADRVADEMDDIVGLSAIAQGLADPSVKSGFHATQVVEQAIVGLSDLRDNLHTAYKRAWRIMLQTIRTRYTTEQQRRYLGDGNDYVVAAFTGADLEGTRDVTIAAGSGTMMTPSAKAAMAEHLASSGLIDAPELKRIISTNVGGLIGLQDDPHEQRVKRQIRRWMEGIPKAIQQAMEAEQQAPPPVPMVDPATGQPVPPPPTPGQQQLSDYVAELFDRRPVDQMPDVAMVRYLALSRAIDTTKYAEHPQPWRQVLTAEWDAMRQAAGAQTVQEQANAAAEDRKPPSESINYKDVPPDVQRQMEAQAGFQPSQVSPDEHRTHVAAMHAGEGQPAGQGLHRPAHPNAKDPGAPHVPRAPGAVPGGAG